MNRTIKNFIEHGWLTPTYAKTCSLTRSTDDDLEIELAQHLHIFFGYGLLSAFILANAFKYKIDNSIDLNSANIKKYDNYLKTLYEKNCLSVDDIANIFTAKERLRMVLSGCYKGFVYDEKRLWF